MISVQKESFIMQVMGVQNIENYFKQENQERLL